MGIHFGLFSVPFFVAWIWLLSSTRIAPVRWLEAKWLVVLGEASNGLYLLHVPLLDLFQRLHLTGSVWDYPLYFGISMGSSVLSFYYFETPARRWILSRFHSTPTETLEAASDAQKAQWSLVRSSDSKFFEQFPASFPHC
jgi:peptidoglycan/LPS O-acetylase OafA/YrhL